MHITSPRAPEPSWCAVKEAPSPSHATGQSLLCCPRSSPDHFLPAHSSWCFFFSSTKVLVGKSFFHLLACSVFYIKAPQNQLDVSTADTIAEKQVLFHIDSSFSQSSPFCFNFSLFEARPAAQFVFVQHPSWGGWGWPSECCHTTKKHWELCPSTLASRTTSPFPSRGTARKHHAW